MSVYRGVLLYGDSGAGKSSLLNAGLMPLLIERGFAPTRIRVQPREDAELVVEPWLEADDSDSSPTATGRIAGGEPGERMILSVSGFREYVEAVRDERRAFLIFDQFEELVTLFDTPPTHELQQRLLALIAELMHGSLRVKLLIAFRDDYLGKLKELLADCPELVNQALRLAPPSVDALRTIISGPFDRYPGHFEHPLSPAVVDKLIAALAERFGAGEVSLSEVQTVCLRLWQSETPDTLLEQRGVQGLLEDYLGEAIDEMPQQLQDAAIALLAQMITEAGTRNVISAGDLFQRVREHEGHQTSTVLEEALERLSQSRLVRRERRRDLDLYEITTEFLVPWISHRRDELRRVQDRRRERRRVLIFVSIAAALLILGAGVTVLAVWALVQRDRAKTEAVNATSLALASDAQPNTNARPDVAMLLLLKALKPYHGNNTAPFQARSNMIAALEAVRASGLRGILQGQAAAVNGVAFSPGGRILASASQDETVRLWDVETHEQIGPPLTGHTGVVNAVAFSPDGRMVASSGSDKTVRLWDVASHRQIGPPLTGDRESITAVAFSPDGRTLASASYDRTVRLWNVATHRQLGATLTGDNIFTGVAFSPDGRSLASSSTDGTVSVWDVATHKLVSVLGSHTGLVSSLTCVAFSPDGRTMASGSYDDTVLMWDVATHKQRGAPLKGHTGIVLSVAFSRDGRTLVSGGADNTVRLWGVATHRQLRSPLTGHTGIVRAVTFSPDGRTVASASDDDTIRLWGVSQQNLGAILMGDTGFVKDVSISPDGRTLASASDDRTIRLWDLTTRRQLGAPLTGHAGTVNAVAFSPDGHTLASASDDRTVRLWDVGTHKQLGAPLTGHTHAVNAVAFSPDGHVLASASDDRTIRLWSVATHKQVGALLPGHTDSVIGVRFSPDGRILASASDDGTVRLWDVGSRTQLGALSTGTVNGKDGVAFSPDGRTVAYDGGDFTVRLWDVATHKQLGAPLTGHTDNIEALDFSPDGRTLVSAGDDQTLRLWDVATHKQLGAPLAGDDIVLRAAFSPDGLTLASVSLGGVVTLWSGFLWHDFASLSNQTCSVVGPGLSQGEWSQYAPGIAYQRGCP